MPRGTRTTRRLLLVAAGAVLAAGAVEALVVEGSPALALVLVAQAAVMALLLVQRRRLLALGSADRDLRADLGRLRKDVSRLAARVQDDALAEPVAAALGAARLDALARHRDLQAGLDGVHGDLADRIDQGRRGTAADTSALLNLFTLLPVTQEVPAPDGWAMDAPALLAAIGQVLSRPGDTTVVECGSGTSTVWLAYALRHKGGGRLVTLEHDEAFAARTADALVRNGLADWAEVRTCPLQEVRIGEETFRWYARQAWQDLRDVDVLVVDGPPGNVGRLSRYPALPLLGDALRPDAVVVVDDVERPDEQEELHRWVREQRAGLHLADRRRAGRAEVLTLPATRRRPSPGG